VLSVPAENLLGPSRRMQRITAVLIALFLASAIALAIMLSRSITGPIGRLSETMRRFGSGELRLRSGRTRGDEIGRLQESFDHMAGEIEQLLAAVGEEHRRRRKLELDVLEEQINPHFLYNILDSLNWMAQRAGQQELGEMVAALARFFRIGLSGGRDVIPVVDELEHARNYLVLSRMRFRDCFRFGFEVEDGVERLRTPKIVLQPLIENAISHGLDKAARDGEVRVRCWTDDGDLLFSVQDNGRGIAPDALAEIRRRLERGEGEPEYEGGIGLLNVSQRIRLHYGDGYGLAIESAPGRGTTVTVRMPRGE
jgi:two-component system sensor histidine kinase YesM